MEEFFRFWRRIPRFLFGLATVLVITAAVLGKEQTLAAISAMSASDLKDLGDVPSSVLIAFALLSIGSFGVFLLEVVALGAEGVVHWLAYRLPDGAGLQRLGLRPALFPVPQLALDYYHAHRALILEFMRLRSRATPGHDLSFDDLSEFYEAVGKHMDSIADPGFLSGFGYMTRLTQDQVKLENRFVEVREIYYFIFLVMALLSMALRFRADVWIWGTLLAVLIASLMLAVPMVRQRKQELAIAIVFGYCDNFAVAEGATIEDRADF